MEYAAIATAKATVRAPRDNKTHEGEYYVMTDKKNVQTKIERANIIRQVVLSHDERHGKWTTVDMASGGFVRVREIDAGLGWSAYITSRFSGGAAHIPAAGHDTMAMPRAASPSRDDVVMDVWAGAGPKVLSLATTGADLKVIRMVPGRWEQLFGVATAAAPSIGRTARRAKSGQGGPVPHHA